jgi:hypothetical protein
VSLDHHRNTAQGDDDDDDDNHSFLLHDVGEGGGGALMTHVADLSIIIRGCNRIDSRVSSANSF